MRRVVVAGGGITGLAAAWRILKTAGPGAVEVLVFEARERLGGNVLTDHVDGFVIDGGPDSFVVTKPEATALCKELGLGDHLIETIAENRRVLVGRRGELHPMPDGLMLTVPARVLPMAKSRLFSWPGKARMLLDLALPRGKEEDESIGAFVRRRLGDEAVDRLAEPLLGGIYAGDVDALSLKSTFPQLLDLEQRHGSLIRGAMAMRRAAAAKRKPGAPPPSAFHSLRGGMGELVDALRSAIEKAGGTIRSGVRVEEILRARADGSGHVSGKLRVRIAAAAARSGSDASEAFEADDVVLTLPAWEAAKAVGRLDEELARGLAKIPYLGTATIALAYRASDVRHPLDALGIIFPRSEKRPILAATFISSKWEHRAPEGSVLLRVFVGGHRDPGALSRSDAELVDLGRAQLAELVGAGEPLHARVYRFERNNPQPVVGHAALVRDLKKQARDLGGLWLAGAAYDGVGIPDCVRQANETAAAILGRAAESRA